MGAKCLFVQYSCWWGEEGTAGEWKAGIFSPGTGDWTLSASLAHSFLKQGLAWIWIILFESPRVLDCRHVPQPLVESWDLHSDSWGLWRPREAACLQWWKLLGMKAGEGGAGLLWLSLSVIGSCPLATNTDVSCSKAPSVALSQAEWLKGGV